MIALNRQVACSRCMSSFAGSYTKVCSDSDEMTIYSATQQLAWWFQNGSIARLGADRWNGNSTPIPLMDPRRRRVQMEFRSKVDMTLKAHFCGANTRQKLRKLSPVPGHEISHSLLKERYGYSARKLDEEAALLSLLWWSDGDLLRLSNLRIHRSQVKRLKKQEQKQSLEREGAFATLVEARSRRKSERKEGLICEYWPAFLSPVDSLSIQYNKPIPFRFHFGMLGDEENNFGIQLLENSAKSFRVGKDARPYLGQAGKAFCFYEIHSSKLFAFFPSLGSERMPGRIEGIRTRMYRGLGVGPRERQNSFSSTWETGSPKLRFGGLGGALS
ncbi:hypothetical protein Tco_1400342 [Tanacetum coccineum]